MSDLIINGIDHSKFDLEWAKRGGVIFDSVYEQIYIFVNKIDEEQIRLVYSSRLRGEIDFLSKSLISSLRMATPAECAEAGVEYIEPPMIWRDIESAPKNTVVITTNGFYVTEAFFSPSRNDWIMRNGDELSVTHWMPRPQPLKDE